MKRFNPGWARHQFSFKTIVFADDGSGGQTETPTTIGPLWGFVEPASAHERSIGSAFVGVQTHWLTCRARTDITTRAEVTRGSRTFKILEPPRKPETIGRMRWMRLSLQELT